MQNTNLNIRIDKDLKDKFILCVAKAEYPNKPSYSNLIREFIEQYIKEHEENKWSSMNLTESIIPITR